MGHLSVSVVIPTFDRAALVPRAVHSALGAIAPGDEVIVVDDGSTDGTETGLAPYRDRIRYVRTAHRGAGAARNRGVQEARCPLVAFLDSDDEWMSDKLALQRVLMARRPDVLFTFSDFALRDRDGREYRRQLAAWHHDRRRWDEILGPGRPFSTIGALPAGRADFAVHTGDIYPALMTACYVSTITTLVRREAGQALRFAEDLPLYEDWECFARLARAGRAAYLDCETAWNHGHPGLRLTGADALTTTGARLSLLSRVWGSDAAFLADSAEAYYRVLSEQHLLRARALLKGGRTTQARRELRLAGGGPLAYRAFARLPEPLARGLATAALALLGM